MEHTLLFVIPLQYLGEADDLPGGQLAFTKHLEYALRGFPGGPVVQNPPRTQEMQV